MNETFVSLGEVGETYLQAKMGQHPSCIRIACGYGTQAQPPNNTKMAILANC
jgi:hypothetical protein